MVTIKTNAEENDIPEIKKNVEKWNRDFSRCVLVTKILFHFGIINILKETLG